MQTGEGIIRSPMRLGVGRTRSMVTWGVTGLFAAIMALSGAAFVAGPPSVVASLRHLGYPDYFRSLLGVAKLLGVAAIVVPRLAALREWAYAGFAFVMLGAAASHLASGEPPSKAVPPLFVLALLLTSYFLRRRARPQ
jgi:DoxX-like family